MTIKRIARLLQKDLTIEFRDTYSIGAVLLYVITTSYIVFKAFQTITPQSWNVLFWIIFLFAALNALLNSFSKDSQSQYLYYYQLIHPSEFIIAKVIYNTITLLIVSALLFGALSLFTFNPITNMPVFIGAVVLGTIGVSTCFTFVSSVAASGQDNSVLMSILALPLIIPILLLVIKLGAQAIGLIENTGVRQDFILLGGIDLILIGLVIILFPQIWRS